MATPEQAQAYFLAELQKQDRAWIIIDDKPILHRFGYKFVVETNYRGHARIVAQSMTEPTWNKAIIQAPYDQVKQYRRTLTTDLEKLAIMAKDIGATTRKYQREAKEEISKLVAAYTRNLKKQLQLSTLGEYVPTGSLKVVGSNPNTLSVVVMDSLHFSIDQRSETISARVVIMPKTGSAEHLITRNQQFTEDILNITKAGHKVVETDFSVSVKSKYARNAISFKTDLGLSGFSNLWEFIKTLNTGREAHRAFVAEQMKNK